MMAWGLFVPKTGEKTGTFVTYGGCPLKTTEVVQEGKVTPALSGESITLAVVIVELNVCVEPEVVPKSIGPFA